MVKKRERENKKRVKKQKVKNCKKKCERKQSIEMADNFQNSEKIFFWIQNLTQILNEKRHENNETDYVSGFSQRNLEKLEENVENIIIHYLEIYIRKHVAPKFWKYFKFITNEQQGFQDFQQAVNELYSSFDPVLPLIKQLEDLMKNKEFNYSSKNVNERFKLLVGATLLSQIPLHHDIIIEHFYKISFKVFCNNDTSDNSEVFSDHCRGCNQEQSKCECKMIIFMFHETNRKLLELGLLERLVGNVLTSLINIRIKNYVSHTCNRSFNVSLIEPLNDWLGTVVLSWLVRIYSGSLETTIMPKKTSDAIETFKQKLQHYMHETYTKVRIEQLFNIIIEYPNSLPAIFDLRTCLQRTDLRKNLIETLQDAFKTRLLHPGVTTQDILTAYIAAIKVLRQLDPTGVLLETTTEPIKLYLGSREDTVRCVVSGLLDDSDSDLAEELAKSETLQLDDASGEEEIENWEKWMPDPVDADPSRSTQRKMSDIISMLISVYGSQDLFVNEYRTLLADRLLSQMNYHTERELRHLELLKRRFGEHQLHYCEVMLKDVYDSKRIDGNIQSDTIYCAEKEDFTTSALILSAQFWPPFKEEWKLELPKVVQNQLARYVKAFEALKGNRTLCWKPHLGNVNLEIELKDRKINLNVTPIHATIILHFQEKHEWTLEKLSEIIHAPTTVLRRKIGFWVTQGVLKETANDTYTLQEESCSKSHSVSEIVEDDEGESAMASASDQREGELQVFWSYIVGMLTNLDSMPLERIHQMLKMFASQGLGTVECSLSDLKLFLDRKVREHHLILSGNLYRLSKT